MPALNSRANLSGKPPARRKVVYPLPSHAQTLVEPAPLTLMCPVCDTARCARTDRTLLWHGEYNASGKTWECAGAGLPGLDLAR